MKILITDIHHGNGGGYVTYVLSLLKGLKGQYDLTVAAPPTGRLYRAASAEQGVRVLPGLYTSRPLTLLKEVWRLRKFLRQERFDVVHVNGGADHRHVMLASIGLRHRPAIVWTKHNTNPVCSFGHRMRARFGTHASIAVCEYVARILGQSGYSRHPISVVRNGIDHNYLQPVDPADRQAFRNRLFGPLDDDVLVLGSIGGTDYNKGWLDLVQAVSRLAPDQQRRLRIVVAGDPPTPCMQAKVDLLAMRKLVIFPGLVKDVRTVLGACDIGFVLSYREAASYASCETMAMGLPALVSNAGGLPENVRDGLDGWVVPAGDIDAMTDALRRILENPQALAALGRSARERVEHMFSTPGFIEDTKKVYAQANRLVRDLTAPI
ncbi:glycosyltransferase family 4 protein [Pollutimonas sp. H1-120]|uniref:glycosyltransferase family 4 protein n=1 Tax=Pollutimonas sp. H1-120 TaxID=3148824 RepID=UPI003B515734